jgi:leader peptidase (prepilin peptidase)/N-methyltransferase
LRSHFLHISSDIAHQWIHLGKPQSYRIHNSLEHSSVKALLCHCHEAFAVNGRLKDTQKRRVEGFLGVVNLILIAMGIAALLGGLIVGSFLNVIIQRLPRWEVWKAHHDLDPLFETKPPPNIATPRSHCPHCTHTLSTIELIPIVSYVALKGRCRYCQKPIGTLYPLVEGATGLLTLLAVVRFGFVVSTVWALVFIYFLIALIVIDWRELQLPDYLTQPLLWLGLGLALFQDDDLTLLTFSGSLHAAVAGAILGFMSLWILLVTFKWLTGRDGMGYGDLKLLAAIGAWLGASRVLNVLFVASIIGLMIAGALLILKKRSRSEPLAFGSFLGLAALWILLCPPTVFDLFHLLKGH